MKSGVIQNGFKNAINLLLSALATSWGWLVTLNFLFIFVTWESTTRLLQFNITEISQDPLPSFIQCSISFSRGLKTAFLID